MIRVVLIALLLAAGIVRAEDAVPGAEQYYNANALYNKGLHALAIEEYRAFIARNPAHAKIEAARLGLALSYYAAGRFREAEPLLATAKAGDPTQLKLLRAECLASTDRPGDAEKLFAEVATAGDAKYAADAWAALTDLAYRQKKWAETDTRARKLLAADAGSKWAGNVLYQAAFANYELKKPAAAMELLEKLLAEPRATSLTAQGTLLLGEIHREAGRHVQAAEQYEKLVGAAGEAAAPDILFRLGYVRFQAGQFPEAAQALRQALAGKADPATAAQARLMLGRALLEQGDFRGAAQALQPLAEGKDPEALLWYARVSSRQKKFKEAAEILAPAMQRNPTPALLFDYANALIAEEKFAAAAKALEPLLTKRDWPQRAEVLRLHALCLHQAGNYAGSLASANLFTSEFPASAEMAFVRAENLFFLDKLDEALTAYQEFAKTFPADKNAASVQYRLVVLFHRKGMWKEVVERAKPGMADFMVGDSLFRLERWAEAIARLTAFVQSLAKSDPNADTAWLEIGLAHQRLGQPDQAAAAFEQVVAKHAGSPHLPVALAELGRLRYEAGDHKSARQALERVVTDSRHRLKAEYYLGWIALAEKKEDEAVTRFSSVAGTRDGGELAADAALQAGLVRLSQEKYPAAQNDLATLLKSFPQHPRRELAVFSLGVALARQKNWRGAEDQFKTLIDRQPPSEFAERALYELAWCAKGLDRDAQAATYYRRLIAEHGDSELVEKARTELAELTFDAKQYEAVIAELTASLPAMKDPKLREQTLYRLGTAYVGKADPENAAKTFEALVAEFPASALLASAQFQAGECRLKLKELPAARALFQAVAQNKKEAKLREPGLLRWGETEAQLGQWTASAKAYETLLADFPQSKWADRARFGMAWALEKQGQFRRALAEYAKIVAAGKTDELSARSQFQVGECLFALQEYDKAVVELTRVGTAYRHDDWRAKAALEIGRVLEAKGDKAKALAQFRDVLQKFPRHDVAAVARERLTELRREEK